MSGVELVLGLVFLTIVAPIWIIAHYLTRWRTARALAREDERMLVELWEATRRMEARIENLEKVFDVEAPGWRRTGT